MDVIVEHAGRWAGIEVKLSDTKADDAARNLLALKRKVTSNPAAQNAEPAFLAVIVAEAHSPTLAMTASWSSLPQR